MSTLATRLICHAAVWPEEVLHVIDRFRLLLPELERLVVGASTPDARQFFDLLSPAAGSCGTTSRPTPSFRPYARP